MRALAILCVVPAFSLGLIAGVTHLVGPLEPSAQQTNLVWSNRVFTTRSDFETWLASRGSNYELWSQRHPAAARHFDASASAQDSKRQAQSSTALLIAIISCVVLLALLALPTLVRSARVLLEPPKTRLRLRGPPSTILATAAKHGKVHVPHAPASALIEGASRFDWREDWSRLSRRLRIHTARAAYAGNSNSYVLRRYLPKVAFYVVAVILSFAIGAWVAIYLQ
jgi:hypothetical protein